MDKSIFTDKTVIPTDSDLANAIGPCYDLWQNIKEYVLLKYPKATAEWKYPGDKYGWNFRLKDKKRAIIYLLPRDQYFKVAFVFGQKATDAVLASPVSEAIKAELAAARAYAEGRGITIDVKNSLVVSDVKELVAIKMAH